MLLDTSGLICVFDTAQPHHQAALAAYHRMTRGVLHNYIVAEFVALAETRRLPRQRSLRFIADICIHPRVSYIWVDQPLHDRGLSLLMAQLDKSYSLCDAVSFVLLRRENMNEALTTDHHFEQAGFTRLLK